MLILTGEFEPNYCRRTNFYGSKPLVFEIYLTPINLTRVKLAHYRGKPLSM